ncbi:MAG: thiosulfate/3-mercaptopyruvate sulfurtransferase [Actinomycetota bacterium]|nr:thiosulfate/3-mercaptopyruvate sulfurtransferase [Actinomycetota bacterium]
MVAPIVDASWLGDHPEAVLADVRWYADGRSGQAAYEQAHLPGAVFVDLDRYLAGPPSGEHGRHPLPDPEVFAAGMREAGIGDEDVVVAYDDDSGAICARLVWMLRVTGHQATMLDGGVTAWRGRRESGAVTRAPAAFTAQPWPAELLAEIDQLEGVPVLDARPADRYRGENEVLDRRPGHIPGARSLPARDNSDDRGLLLPVPELRARLTAAGVAPGWVSSCGSGVTACHTLLLAEHLGLPRGRLYPGSWSQWAATGRRAVTGDAP